MILHVVGLALAGYFIGVLTVVFAGTVVLTIADEADACADFDKSHAITRRFAWRWPVDLPVATATVMGITVGLVLLGLGCLYRRIVG